MSYFLEEHLLEEHLEDSFLEEHLFLDLQELDSLSQRVVQEATKLSPTTAAERDFTNFLFITYTFLDLLNVESV